MTEQQHRYSRAAGMLVIGTFLFVGVLLHGGPPGIPTYIIFAGALPFAASEAVSPGSKLRWFLIGTTVGLQLAGIVCLTLLRR